MYDSVSFIADFLQNGDKKGAYFTAPFSIILIFFLPHRHNPKPFPLHFVGFPDNHEGRRIHGFDYLFQLVHLLIAASTCLLYTSYQCKVAGTNYQTQ